MIRFLNTYLQSLKNIKMKNTKVRSRGFALVFFLVLSSCAVFVSYTVFFKLDRRSEKQGIEKHIHKVRLTDLELSKLEEGDLILRRGYGFFSNYIADFLNKPPYDVTHAGILVKTNSEWEVIHSLASDVSDIDGVQKEALSTFLKASQPEKIVVVRVKGCSVEKRKQIAQYGLIYLAQEIAFDHLGDYDNGDKMYCTEMIWRILEKDLRLVTLPQTKEERDLHFFSMEAMYDSQYFDFVIDQFNP